MRRTRKIPAWQLTKLQKQKRRWPLKQGMWAKPYTLRRWSTYVISRIRSWSHSFKNTKVELFTEVTLNRIVFAVFIEQGSSASQVTAAKAMEIISRLPGCARQGADAVSAYTQVKMEDAPTLLKIPKSECPDVWIRILSEICVVIFWQDYYVEGNSRKFFWNLVGRRFQIVNVSLNIVKKDYSYPCMWTI